ncbi:MAG TPA: hypothetical protein VGD43_03865 [Micromonospora sp.]
MRLTVGPLPSAVYWRRRAVVLGAGLLFVIVLLYSCSGSGDPKSGTQASKSSSPPAAGPSVDPTPTDVLPTESASAETGLPPAGEPAPGSSSSGPVTVTPAAGPADGSCADAEISVIPVPAPTSVRQGAAVDLRLKIKNISNRTCSRDVGADLQEIYIKIGAQRIWSSDTCGTAKGSDVQSFIPNFEREYLVTWNGRESSRCDGGLASGSKPEPGEYQVFGRLGTKVSAPVKLTIRA